MSPKEKRTCGDHGGRTARGTPCRRHSPKGLCASHAEDERPRRLWRAPHHAQKRAFLVALAEMGNITGAARAAGIDRRRHYDWLQDDPEYREEFEVALETAADLLEVEARRRAMEGDIEPVVRFDKKSGEWKAVSGVRRRSDTLLIFLLKGIRPEKYRERSDIRGRVVLTWEEMIRRLDDDAEAA